MKKYIPILKNTQLFKGVADAEFSAVFSCFEAKKREYKKGEYILSQGNTLGDIVILVEGSAHIQRDDYWGNRSILSDITVGDMFGEAYVSPNGGPLLNDVIAVEDSVAIFFKVDKILHPCAAVCSFHSVVMQNLFFSLCEKNKLLVQKLRYMSGRTTREKLIAYLSEQAKNHNSASFTIPFNRQQLADYLSVDRSAMSNELCKMRNDGLLIFRKNQFTLL